MAIFEFGRARLYSADFGSLLTDHHSFRVTFSNTHTPYVDFFFEYKVLDDNDFFDYGQDCRITFFSDCGTTPTGRPIGTRSTSTRIWERFSSI